VIPVSSNAQQPQLHHTKVEATVITEFEKAILDLFKRLSVCIAIMGRRDTGKTDLALLIMEILAKFDIIKNFATNIRIYKAPFETRHITNLVDLEYWCQNTPGRKLFILDEAGKTIRRRSAMSRLNIKMLDNLQILRKYKLSLEIVFPADKYIDSAVLGSDVLDAVILKPHYKNRKVALYHDIMEDIEIWFTDVPPTNIHFDSWDIAPFTEKPKFEKPRFKEKDTQILWDWSHGKSLKDLGLHPMQINRLVRRFIKDTLEKQLHPSPTIAKED